MAIAPPKDERVELPPFSMFAATPIYRQGDNLEFGLLRDAVLADQTDQIYTVNQITENRLDLVSDLAYGTPHLWWVIALANNILDPFLIPRQTRLRVPLKSRLSIPQ